MLNRRDALNLGATAAASVLASTSGGFAREHDDSLRLVDTNISLFHWPFRRLPLDELVRLLKRLRTLGVDQAWAGSFEAVLHRDMAGVNRRLAEACKNHNELVPIGSVNLELPDWEEDLRRCFDEHQMPGVRLHPNYHAYTLNDPRFVKLLKVATAAKRMVQIAALIEDSASVAADARRGTHASVGSDALDPRRDRADSQLSPQRRRAGATSEDARNLPRYGSR